MADGSAADAVRPIILVDDDTTDCLLIQRCYAESGCRRELLVYPSGPDLVSYLCRAACGEVSMPFAVLLDLNLYGVTGLDVLRRVRQDPNFREVPPIYMLTHSHDVEDRQRALALGATGYFTKPGDIAGLAQLLASIVDETAQTSQVRGTDAGPG